MGGQKIVHPQPPPKRQGQIDLTKLPHPLHSYPGKIDLRPLRRRRRCDRQPKEVHRLLGTRRAIKQARDLFPARPLVFIKPRELAQRGDYPLARTALGAITLHQAPVLVLLAVLLPTIAPQKHATKPEPSCSRKARGWSPLQRQTPHNHPPRTESNPPSEPQKNLPDAATVELGLKKTVSHRHFTCGNPSKEFFSASASGASSEKNVQKVERAI